MNTVEKYKAAMLAAAPAALHDELRELMEKYPFQVEKLEDWKGGDYNSETRKIRLADNLDAADVLRIFLHETVHAGAWSNGFRILPHDEYFARLMARLCERYGIERSSRVARYDMRDTAEEWTARQPSWAGLLALVLLTVCAMAAYYAGLGVWLAGLFGVLAVAAALLERWRQRLAGRDDFG